MEPLYKKYPLLEEKSISALYFAAIEKMNDKTLAGKKSPMKKDVKRGAGDGHDIVWSIDKYVNEVWYVKP